MTDLAKVIKTDDDVYKTLLESTKAIPWKIDWATMKFAYIGPQIESLLGWSPQSWATVDDWAARMHEDDRERAVNFCVTQSNSGIDHEADYRALTKDGRHVWIRDVVHVVRNLDGSVNALVGFMFDISERKIAEEQLAHAASPVSQMLTLSLGIGTVVPAQEGGMMDFIAAVDRQLYQAKQQGRDRIAAGA